MRIALPALACALSQPLLSQQVFVVDQAGGPGVYTDIWLALAAGADDGDVILVREGAYGHFEIQGQGVSVVADAGATPTLAYAYDTGLRISGLDPDDAVVLRGLAFTMLTLDGGAHTLLDVSAGGAVLIEDCTFTDGRPSLRVRQGARVALERCIVEGIDGALGTPWWGSWGPGNGIIVEGETSVGNSSVSGGMGFDGSYDGISLIPASAGGDAIFVMGAGVLNLRNSRLEGGLGGDGHYDWECHPPGTGGAGLHLVSGAPVARLVGATLVGGLAGDPVGAPHFCPPGVPGPGLLQDAGTVEGLAGPAPELAVGGVVREAQTLLGTVTGEPGALALLGIGAAPPVYLPALCGVLQVGAPLQPIVLGTIPASGVLPLAALVGELGPGISAAQVMLQAATCGSGGCALGAGSVAVLLDAAY